MQIAAPLTTEPVPVLQWIEVATFFQIPGFQIIGLPSPEVAEARERVRAAITSIGEEFPKKRIILNLSPASIKKRGTGADLAIALAILACKKEALAIRTPVAASGELSLDGELRPVGNSMRVIAAAWDGGVSHLLLPREDFEDAKHALLWISQARPRPKASLELIPVKDLKAAWEFLCTGAEAIISPACEVVPIRSEKTLDSLLPLAPSVERVVLASVAGGHHLLLLGPKGTGKSQALEWIQALQPPASAEARVKHALLTEARGDQIESGPIVRRVGSQTKPAALLGNVSGGVLKPGEFSLAHGGLLIADELPEWPRDSREVLREPLETGSITFTRALGKFDLPAQFTLAANGNLCPCGGWPPHLPVPKEAQGFLLPPCSCRTTHRLNYFRRLSGPVMDRIDLVSLVVGTKPSAPSQLEKLQRLKETVLQIQEKAIKSWGALPGKLHPARLEELLRAHPTWAHHLGSLPMTSLRSRHKVLRVGLTLSLLDGAEEPLEGHFIEASCYRPERFEPVA